MAANLKIDSVVTVGTEENKYSWSNVDGHQLVRMERRLINVLGKMNEAAQDYVSGINIPAEVNKQTVTYAFNVFKDSGEVYTQASFTWPNLPEAAVTWIKGVLAGEMGEFEGSAKKFKSRRQR